MRNLLRFCSRCCHCLAHIPLSLPLLGILTWLPAVSMCTSLHNGFLWLFPTLSLSLTQEARSAEEITFLPPWKLLSTNDWWELMCEHPSSLTPCSGVKLWCMFYTGSRVSHAIKSQLYTMVTGLKMHPILVALLSLSYFPTLLPVFSFYLPNKLLAVKSLSQDMLLGTQKLKYPLPKQK